MRLSAGTYAAKLDSVLIEGGPFDDIRLQRVVNFGDQFESQCLYPSQLEVYRKSQVNRTLRMVVGGIQWLNRS